MPVGLLDRFQVAGAVATWWGEVVFDLKTLMARGFEGVVEGWVTTIVTALEERRQGRPPGPQAGQGACCREFLDEIAEAEGQVAELDGTIKAATATGEDDEDGDGGGGRGGPLRGRDQGAEEGSSRRPRRGSRPCRRSFADRLEEAQAELDAEQAEALVLGILQGRSAPGAGPAGGRPPAGGRVGGRELVGQVPGDAAGHRGGAGRGEGAAGWVPGGVGLCRLSPADWTAATSEIWHRSRRGIADRTCGHSAVRLHGISMVTHRRHERMDRDVIRKLVDMARRVADPQHTPVAMDAVVPGSVDHGATTGCRRCVADLSRLMQTGSRIRIGTTH